MDITKLLEDIIPTRQSIKYNRTLDNDDDDSAESRPINKNVIGRGHYSHVAKDKDPHMVKKYNHNLKEEDPYHTFIDSIIDNGMTNNPWFPRIYNIKEYTDSEGKTGRKYTLEKLISYDEIDEELLIAFIQNLFSHDKFEFFMNLAKDPMELRFYNNDKKRLLHSAYTKYLGHLLSSSRLTGADINDENLKEALNFIKDIIKKTGYYSDFHANNLMYRRTKYGIQGVIADPLSG